ncbi:MAG TPA: hypothetical protein VK968_14830 [Roseimicrobium sp.]|nr:hypothetical protein [Roseimicrobium sp.]
MKPDEQKQGEMDGHGRFTTFQQSSPYQGPWPLKHKLGVVLWEYCWAVFCWWTPKPFNPWRIFWLRLFGCKITGSPFVHQRARIEVPWNLSLGDRACLGDRASVYSLGEIEIHEDATVAQEAYLCSGTHRFDDPNRSLQTAKIIVRTKAFVCARAFVLPGLIIGQGAVVGACSVVTRDVPDGAHVAGNPARILGKTRA